ncbi:TPA: glycosyltransferase family 2 protein, partial [Streptococcus suis]
MPKSLVSIIVPVYNAEKYLIECLDSISNQSYENIEVILLNDGSTDGSKDICQRYVENDSRIVLINKDNSGVSSTRNMGLYLAKGEYITFVDSDDYIESTMVEKLLRSIKENKSDFSICGHRMTGNKRGFNDSKRLSEITVAPSREFLKAIITTGNNRIWGYSCRIMYSKKIIDINNLQFDTQKIIAEDIEFLCKYIALCSTGSVVNEELYIYRIHQESVTNRYKENDYEIRRQVDDWFWENFVKFDPTYLPGYYQCRANTYHGYISNLSLGFSLLELIKKRNEIY